jgi:peptidoglycan/xylan/chitin deacetylase (PgdA/CDA1 family)
MGEGLARLRRAARAAVSLAMSNDWRAVAGAVALVAVVLAVTVRAAPDMGAGAAAAGEDEAAAGAAAVGGDRGPLLPPNEGGRVAVLMYHRIGDPAVAPELTVTPDQFRAQLAYLYANGYHPVNFRDLVEGRMDVPAGRTPVVLTFDDSSDSQFTFVEEDGRLVPDPDGAVGILAAFSRDHPDWPMRATFFVLPGASPPNDLFGQPEHAAAKLRWLVDHGMEVGNHSLWHADLASLGDAAVQEQLGLATQAIEAMVPGYDVATLALPYGNYPANETLVQAGSHRGVVYRLAGAVEALGGPAYSPWDARFDPYHVPRVQPEPHKGVFDATFGRFEAHPEERYVSDGDPGTVTVPAGGGANLDRDALAAAGVAVVERPG